MSTAQPPGIGGGPRRRGGGWVLPVLLVLLIAIPIAEVWLLIQVGQRIGVPLTVAILIAEAILGGWLMRREGERAWRALNEAFGSGMPTGELADAALILVGGVLLMLPGFFTDLIGLFFLLPFTRPSARTLLAFLLARRLRRMGVVPQAYLRRDGTVIEGETVPDPPTGPSTTKDSSGPIVIAGEVEDGRPERS